MYWDKKIVFRDLRQFGRFELIDADAYSDYIKQKKLAGILVQELKLQLVQLAFLETKLKARRSLYLKRTCA